MHVNINSVLTVKMDVTSFLSKYISKLFCAVTLFCCVTSSNQTFNSRRIDTVFSISRERSQNGSLDRRWTGIESRAKRSTLWRPMWIYWVWDIYISKDCPDLISKVNSASFPYTFGYCKYKLTSSLSSFSSSSDGRCVCQ